MLCILPLFLLSSTTPSFDNPCLSCLCSVCVSSRKTSFTLIAGLASKCPMKQSLEHGPLHRSRSPSLGCGRVSTAQRFVQHKQEQGGKGQAAPCWGGYQLSTVQRFEKVQQKQWNYRTDLPFVYKASIFFSLAGLRGAAAAPLRLRCTYRPVKEVAELSRLLSSSLALLYDRPALPGCFKGLELSNPFFTVKLEAG